jgi:hypothetical protein
MFTGNANSYISHVYDNAMVGIGSVTGLMMLQDILIPFRCFMT